MDPSAIHWRRVKVINPKVPDSFHCRGDDRGRRFAQVQQGFPPKIKHFLSLIRADDLYAIYEEGHIIEVRGERRWILLRLFNTKEKAVIYATVTEESLAKGRFCCFHEDFLVVEDAIHDATVDRYYKREYNELHTIT